MAKPPSLRLGAADWLALAAAPIFAGMALFTALVDDHHIMALRTGAGLQSSIAGMAAMYGLMAVFHLVPWLRLAGFSADLRRKI